MAFLSKLFRRDPAYFWEKGEKLFSAGHYAEAKASYEEALEKLDPSVPQAFPTQEQIKARLRDASNNLARLNLEEARHLIEQQEVERARDHLLLCMDLTEENEVRQMAKTLLNSMAKATRDESPVHGGGGCAGCGPGPSEITETDQGDAPELSPEERFQLLVQTLPIDLSSRYLHMGEEFAKGYLLAQDGETTSALAVLEGVASTDADADIMLYEKGILHYRQGNLAVSENHFRSAIVRNGANPLPYLALAHQLVESGRFPEARDHLNEMINKNFFALEATLLIGEVYVLLNQENDAVAAFSSLLSSPFKREAAQRLVPLLERGGRPDEAHYVRKTYLKGCC